MTDMDKPASRTDGRNDEGPPPLSTGVGLVCCDNHGASLKQDNCNGSGPDCNPASALSGHLEALEAHMAARHVAERLRMEAITAELNRQTRRRRWLYPVTISWTVAMLGLQAYGIATDTVWAVAGSMAGMCLAGTAVFVLLRWELIALRSAGS